MNDENCPAKEMATKNKHSAPSPPEIADFQKKVTAGHTTVHTYIQQHTSIV